MVTLEVTLSLRIHHRAIIQIGIACKKISCYMRDSSCRWLIVECAKIFRSYVKHFWIFPREENCRILIGLNKFSLRGESHINFCTKCVIMTQTRWPITPCHLRHSQNFDKIDSFLKPVLNVFILHNSIVGWRRGLLKKGLVSYTKSIDLEKVLIVGRRRIHQRKSWYYFGPFQTSKAELFLRKLFSTIRR